MESSDKQQRRLCQKTNEIREFIIQESVVGMTYFFYRGCTELKKGHMEDAVIFFCRSFQVSLGSVILMTRKEKLERIQYLLYCFRKSHGIWTDETYFTLFRRVVLLLCQQKEYYYAFVFSVRLCRFLIENTDDNERVMDFYYVVLLPEKNRMLSIKFLNQFLLFMVHYWQQNGNYHFCMVATHYLFRQQDDDSERISEYLLFHFLFKFADDLFSMRFNDAYYQILEYISEFLYKNDIPEEYNETVPKMLTLLSFYQKDTLLPFEKIIVFMDSIHYSYPAQKEWVEHLTSVFNCTFPTNRLHDE